MYNCKFCGKECKNLNSLRNHERCCKQNPNRFIPQGMLGKTSWNKGLKKEQDIRLKLQGEKQSKTKKGKPNHPQTEETKLKLRQYALKQGLGGFNMHRIKYEVNGIQVDSSYEKVVAESLTKNNINWERAKRFKYEDLNNKVHYYTPDFYLPDYNVYLDPKNDYLINNVNPILGYKDLDKINWVMEQNNIKVIILDKEHLIWDKLKDLLPM